MTLYYGIKQILRSPLKSILFLLLAGVSAFLLVLGSSLWEINRTMLEEFEDLFMTVGTVEQKIDHVETYKIWDAGNGYEYGQRGIRGERIPSAVMDFEGAGYILEAKQRPNFGALVDQKAAAVSHMFMIVEATPIESGTADESFPMRAEKVLSGDEFELKAGDIFYICDHSMEEARSFEAGTTYIMMLNYVGMVVHGSRVEHIAPEDHVPEFIPVSSVASHQYTMEGERVYDAVAEAEEEHDIDIVTEGFYETERGKRWLEMAKTRDYLFYTVPVTPTDRTELLMPFYWKDAQISAGRDITEEEYAEGKPVCLISSSLAVLLRKEAGDKLTLPLYCADYSPTQENGMWVASILNAEGKAYSIFHEQEYEIVGIYTAASATKNGYELCNNQVIIPWNAVPENSWADHIAGMWYMTGGNTSFEIPNGTIEDFMAAWEKQGVEELELRFYDNGYTNLQTGLESRKLMAVIFLASGCILALMILCFFANTFITGQRQRIAVERLLGRTKGQCAFSLLTGFFLLAALGTAAGCGAGRMAADRAVEATEQTMEFDKAFSSAVIAQADTEEIEISGAGQKADVGTAVGAGIGLLLTAVLIGSGFMGQALRKEPLQILGELEE